MILSLSPSPPAASAAAPCRTQRARSRGGRSGVSWPVCGGARWTAAWRGPGQASRGQPCCSGGSLRPGRRLLAGHGGGLGQGGAGGR